MALQGSQVLVNAVTGKVKSWYPSYRLADKSGVEREVESSWCIPMSLRKLICFQLFFLAVVVTILCSCQTNAQTKPSLSARIIDALKAKEPGWKYIGAIDNTFLIVPSQMRIVVGTWQGPKSRSQDVVVFIYSVENGEEAAKWLQPVRDKHVYEGWHVSPFQIGDEGYLSKYKNGDRFEIQFRRGTVVSKIAGDDPDRVKEFAQCIVEQISWWGSPSGWRTKTYF